MYLVDIKNNLNVIGWTYKRLKKFVNNKFGGGTVVAKIDNESMIFSDLIFYEGFDVDDFLKFVKDGHIIYDPNTNKKRPYSNFRFRNKDIPLRSINYKEILSM